MRNRVGVILFLALVSGLLAAYLAFRFLRQPTTAPIQAAEVSTVNVATGPCTVAGASLSIWS